MWNRTTSSNYWHKEVEILEVYYNGDVEANPEVLIGQEADIEIPAELVYELSCVKKNGVWKVTGMKGSYEPK